MSAPDPEAPALLRISSNGSIVNEIVDHQGEVLDYQIEPHPEGGVSFRRLDGKDGPYRVCKPAGRLWACTCDDRRRARRECRYCKHRVFALRLLSLAPVVHALEEQLVPKKKPDEVSAPPAEQITPAAAPDAGDELERIAAALAAPFEVGEVKFKPQTITGNRALAVPFVDARVVMGRLDDVLGTWGWEDRYQPQADGSVLCSLTLRVGARSVTKSDVGGQSEQPDEGDRCKAAVSDALKRAAVKFGVGRYLYRQKPQWLGWDPLKRQFTEAPRLPVAGAKQPAPQKARPQEQPHAIRSDFYDGLVKLDQTFTEKGLCTQGDFVKAVTAAGKKAGFPASLHEWSADQIADAREFAKAWEARKKQEARTPAVA